MKKNVVYLVDSSRNALAGVLRRAYDHVLDEPLPEQHEELLNRLMDVWSTGQDCDGEQMISCWITSTLGD